MNRQFITYSYDDPDEASVLDVSNSLAQSRRQAHAQRGAVYSYRLDDGRMLEDEKFEEVRGNCRRRATTQEEKP